MTAAAAAAMAIVVRSVVVTYGTCSGSQLRRRRRRPPPSAAAGSFAEMRPPGMAEASRGRSRPPTNRQTDRQTDIGNEPLPLFIMSANWEYAFFAITAAVSETAFHFSSALRSLFFPDHFRHLPFHFLRLRHLDDVICSIAGCSADRPTHHRHSILPSPSCIGFMTKLAVAGDRFGDESCVDCANLPHVSGRYPLTNTKSTRPMTKISKSIHDGPMV